MDDYIVKPIEPDSLSATVERWAKEGKKGPDDRALKTAAPRPGALQT